VIGQFEGKVAVITGAGSGMGRAAAHLFHEHGEKLVVADISGAQNDTAAEIGGDLIPVQTDIAQAADVETMINIAVDHFGRLDVLFNNAGIDGVLGPIEECTPENFEHVIG
jgi:NAD(P)-dependent dehydrogenase (short-subunit alcohol dehydrogenase family)